MSRADDARPVPDRLTGRASRALRIWEALLLLVGVAVFVANSWASPYFLSPRNLSDTSFSFTEKAMIAFAMALLVVAGEIDLSVAAILALCFTAMGAALQHGAGTPALVATGLGVGVLCGAANGLLVTRAGLPSIVATIGTMSLFRGLSFVVLGDGAFNGYPSSFTVFGQGYVWWVFTWEMGIVAALTVGFGVLLHATSFGRQVFAIGNNPTAAAFSGVRVAQVRMILFLMAGLAAVCLTSRLGSTRPSIARLGVVQVVTMVALGDVSILGGSGSILGVALAAVVMGMVTFGLGLLNVPGLVMSIFTGALLIAVIAAPGLVRLARTGRAA